MSLSCHHAINTYQLQVICFCYILVIILQSLSYIILTGASINCKWYVFVLGAYHEFDQSVPCHRDMKLYKFVFVLDSYHALSNLLHVIMTWTRLRQEGGLSVRMESEAKEWGWGPPCIADGLHKSLDRARSLCVVSIWLLCCVINLMYVVSLCWQVLFPSVKLITMLHYVSLPCLACLSVSLCLSIMLLVLFVLSIVLLLRYLVFISILCCLLLSGMR